MNNGYVSNDIIYYDNDVRSVSEFQIKTMNTNYPISLESLFEAYNSCRKGNSRSLIAQRFEANYEHNLVELWREIASGNYKPKSFRAFVITKPDYREVFAAEFRHRVVLHWIALRLMPIVDRQLVECVFNGRKGKGTLAAQQYAYECIAEVSQNYQQPCYVMKLDIKGFFMSINREMAANIASEFVANNYHESDVDTLQYLLRVSLMAAPEQHCRRVGDIDLWQHIPHHKSLFTCGEGLGLPIGDSLTQIVSLLILDRVHHFIVDTLKLRMAAYADDTFICSESKSKLLASVEPIRTMLAGMGVTLHPHKFYLQPSIKGVKFIGAVLKHGRSYVSNRTVYNAFAKVRAYNARAGCKRYRRDNIDALVASVNSYLGIMRHHASYCIRRRLVRSIDPEWQKMLDIDKGFKKVLPKKWYRKKEVIRRILRKQQTKRYGDNR